MVVFCENPYRIRAVGSGPLDDFKRPQKNAPSNGGVLQRRRDARRTLSTMNTRCTVGHVRRRARYNDSGEETRFLQFFNAVFQRFDVDYLIIIVSINDSS